MTSKHRGDLGQLIVKNLLVEGGEWVDLLGLLRFPVSVVIVLDSCWSISVSLLSRS